MSNRNKVGVVAIGVTIVVLLLYVLITDSLQAVHKAR